MTPQQKERFEAIGIEHIPYFDSLPFETQEKIINGFTACYNMAIDDAAEAAEATPIGGDSDRMPKVYRESILKLKI